MKCYKTCDDHQPPVLYEANPKVTVNTIKENKWLIILSETILDISCHLPSSKSELHSLCCLGFHPWLLVISVLF